MEVTMDSISRDISLLQFKEITPSELKLMTLSKSSLLKLMDLLNYRQLLSSQPLAIRPRPIYT
jgi:hypothetical protein